MWKGEGDNENIDICSLGNHSYEARYDKIWSQIEDNNGTKAYQDIIYIGYICSGCGDFKEVSSKDEDNEDDSDEGLCAETIDETYNPYIHTKSYTIPHVPQEQNYPHVTWKPLCHGETWKPLSKLDYTIEKQEGNEITVSTRFLTVDDIKLT